MKSSNEVYVNSQLAAEEVGDSEIYKSFYHKAWKFYEFTVFYQVTNV